jgi:hypothetical protein
MQRRDRRPQVQADDGRRPRRLAHREPMPRRRAIDHHVLAGLLPRGRAVATHSELRQAGVPSSTITQRIGPTGPWQRALPGVVIAHRGTPTRFERRLGALKYGGEGATLTGLDALCEMNVRTAHRLLAPNVHILVPHERQKCSSGFAVVTRTRRLPDAVHIRGLRCAPIARALVDACRQLQNLDDVRELVADVVQNHGCDPTAIVAEVRAAARQRTALARSVLAEIAAGIRSVAEAKLRKEFHRRGVPQPAWNKDLYTPEGDFVASPDAYWSGYGVALELDSMAWHLAPKRYKKTQMRQRRLVVHNVDVLPVSPADALSDPDTLCGEIMLKLRNAAGRPLPNLIVRERRAA